VVAISADEDEQAYRRFIKQYGINFVTVREPSTQTQHQYGTEKLPESYVIDRNGILRRRMINAADWNSPEIIEFLSRL
jgi:peroxiredoxin